MFNYFKNKLDLYKINKKIKKTETFYWDLIKKAKKDGKEHREREALYQEMMSETYPDKEDLKILQSKIIIKKAERLNVPLPNFIDEEIWEKSFFNIYRLTDKGRFVINKAIREESNERRDGIIQILTVITGLIGVMIGLISVLNR